LNNRNEPRTSGLEFGRWSLEELLKLSASDQTAFLVQDPFGVEKEEERSFLGEQLLKRDVIRLHPILGIQN
jgi:hypothetical protein